MPKTPTDKLTAAEALDYAGAILSVELADSFKKDASIGTRLHPLSDALRHITAAKNAVIAAQRIHTAYEPLAD